MLRRRDRGSRLPERTVDLPGVNVLVRLTAPGVPDGVDLASRVEGVRPAAGGVGTRFLVAAPTYRGDLVDLPASPGPIGPIGPIGSIGSIGSAGSIGSPGMLGPGGPVEWIMSWVTERARWELPVHRADAVSDGPRSWWLTAAGPVHRRQRRCFYRVGCTVPIEVDQLDQPFRTVVGRTLDVSEGGVRCLLPLPQGEAAPGTRVLVRLALDGVDGPLTGVVVRSRRPHRAARVAGWHREVAVAFDDPERNGDAVRRVVVRLQVRARRLAPPAGR